jgi:DNA-3-methyladenine glycosylase II
MASEMTFAIDPRGPFSLARAAGFLGSFPPLGHGGADDDGALRIAFLRDDGEGAAGAVLRQPAADGPLTVELVGGGEPDELRAQVARIFSLDADVAGFPAALARDPVAADATADLAGLRPVLFPTPYEAAAWAVLSARQQLAQAAAIRARLVEEHGATSRVDGRELRTFPPPGNLLEVRQIGGGQALERLRRLHAVAEAALLGELDADVLRDGPEDEARKRLTSIRGIGPYGAGLVLARASGRTDVLPINEPRVRNIVARLYRVDPKDDDAFRRIAEPWRPYRTWVCFLLRNAG